MKTTLLSLLVLTLLTFAPAARAWDGPGQWYESAVGGPNGPAGPGGGGILGTGAASDHNITCANCHIKGANDYGTVDFKPTFNPPIGASYKLAQTYQVTITMSGEHLGLSGCMAGGKNVNEWAATFEDDSGKPVGTLGAENGSSASCPSALPDNYGGKTFTYGDCHAVIGRAEDGTTSWTFEWTAPTTSMPVTLYYAGVDGDCMMDSLKDDAKVGLMKLGGGVALRSVPSSNRALAMVGAFPLIGLVAAARSRGKRRTTR